MSYYSDPTANAAIGAIDRQIRLMKKDAKFLRKRHLQGRLTAAEREAAYRRFSGIFRPILEKALKK